MFSFIQSYFECVQLGVGDPVDESPRSTSSSHQIQRRLTSGAGYSTSNDSRNTRPQRSASASVPSTSGYVRSARSRPSDSTRTAVYNEPIHVDINQFSEPKRRRKVQSKNSNRSKQSQRLENINASAAVVNTRPLQPVPSNNTQSSANNHHQSCVNPQSTITVVHRPRNNAEAVAAHAQRLLAQEKKLARRSIAVANQPVASSSNSVSRPSGS